MKDYGITDFEFQGQAVNKVNVKQQPHSKWLTDNLILEKQATLQVAIDTAIIFV